MHRIDLQNSNIDKKDLDNFKTFTLIFAFSKVGAILVTFISPLLEALINYGGTVFLIIGIFILAKNYPQLASGMKVVVLFIVGILINISSAIFSYLYPIPQINTQNPQQNIQAVANSFYSHAPFIFGFLVLGGIIIFIGAYYFTEWFNKSFTPFNTTKSYLYYGLVFGIGSIVSGVGEYVFARSLTTVDLSTIKTNPHVLDPALPGLTIFVIGSFLILGAVIIQIIAGFKIYNRAKDKAMGKLPFNVVQETANLQPLQNSFQQTIKPNSNPSPSSKNATEQFRINSQSQQVESMDNNVCKNCGAPLEQGTKFCQSCGVQQ